MNFKSIFLSFIILAISFVSLPSTSAMAQRAERLNTPNPLKRELTEKPQFQANLWGPEFRRQMGHWGWGYISTKVDDPRMTTLVEVRVRIPQSGMGANDFPTQSAIRRAEEKVAALGFDPLSIRLGRPGDPEIIVRAVASDKAINHYARIRESQPTLDSSIEHIELSNVFSQREPIAGTKTKGIFRPTNNRYERRAVWNPLGGCGAVARRVGKS
jgi:hypothetical protein